MIYNQLDFATYCIGSLAERLGTNQLTVYEKLKRSNVLYGYIIPAYDVLHTFSGQYITDELIDCLKERGELQWLSHTSYTVVQYPDVRYSREALDFGRGFYVTRLKKQAIDYAGKFRFRGKQAILNLYELQDDWETEVNVKHFEAYDEEWLDFVSANRKCQEVECFDAVEGGIANDKVFRTLDLYFSGDIDKASALKKFNMKYLITRYAY